MMGDSGKDQSAADDRPPRESDGDRGCGGGDGEGPAGDHGRRRDSPGGPGGAGGDALVDVENWALLDTAEDASPPPRKEVGAGTGTDPAAGDVNPAAPDSSITEAKNEVIGDRGRREPGSSLSSHPQVNAVFVEGPPPDTPGDVVVDVREELTSAPRVDVVVDIIEEPPAPVPGRHLSQIEGEALEEDAPPSSWETGGAGTQTGVFPGAAMPAPGDASNSTPPGARDAGVPVRQVSARPAARMEAHRVCGGARGVPVADDDARPRAGGGRQEDLGTMVAESRLLEDSEMPSAEAYLVEEGGSIHEAQVVRTYFGLDRKLLVLLLTVSVIVLAAVVVAVLLTRNGDGEGGCWVRSEFRPCGGVFTPLCGPNSEVPDPERVVQGIPCKQWDCQSREAPKPDKVKAEFCQEVVAEGCGCSLM